MEWVGFVKRITQKKKNVVQNEINAISRTN